MAHEIENIHCRRESPRTNIFRSDYLSVQPLQQWLNDVAPQYAKGILVDYGCGNSPYRSNFAGQVERYIGVDVAQNKLNSVDEVVPPGMPLPVQDNSIGTVLSTQTLEHVSEPEFYLREVFRVLSPGGKLLLTCPAAYMLHEEPNDFFRFTKYGLRHLLEKVGLRIVRIDTAGGAWRLVGQVLLNHKTFGRKWTIPVMSAVIYYCLAPIANLVFSFLDRVNTNSKDTTNYMIIAEKS